MILEVPAEHAPEVHRKFGEPGIGDNQIWCVISKMDLGAVDKPEAEPEKVKKPRKLSQRCAIRCQDEFFWRFLEVQFNYDTIYSSDECARNIRGYLSIESRSEIDSNEQVADRWDELLAEFEHWKIAE